MLIGGLQKMTLIDYPGKVAATIFTVGCNFRCHFCHNPELVLVEPKVENSILHEDEVLNFLMARKNLLEAVCLTGGEPTLQPSLPEFIRKIKVLGYLVKLDTNGTNPEMLEALMAEKLIDYIAMDIKAPWKNYQGAVNRRINVDKFKKSVKLIIESGLTHEFRSTILPALHTVDDVLEMANQVRGAKAYFIQRFKSRENLVNADFVNEKRFSFKELDEIKSKIHDLFEICEIR
jgi:pyruvate formate lyase activating enzyme